MAEIKQYEIKAGWMTVKVSGLQEALNTLVQLNRVGNARISVNSNPLDISRIGGF